MSLVLQPDVLYNHCTVELVICPTSQAKAICLPRTRSLKWRNIDDDLYYMISMAFDYVMAAHR
jgi:hypothetical protein